MKNSEKIEIAIIGGTGLEKLFESVEKLCAETPYGPSAPLFSGSISNKKVAFLPRHGLDHSVPPHKVNYRANIFALNELGVQKVIATNAVGAINQKFAPGDFVVPHDFVDFTKVRATTFYEGTPVTHIDLSQPYCPEIRKVLMQSLRELNVRGWDESVMVCTEGPRLETPAEIEMFRRLGCGVVGMTGFPEVALARELEICYASVCFVSNMAAGMQKRLSAREVTQMSGQVMSKMEKVLIETVKNLPIGQERSCHCARALGNARFE